MALTRIKQSNLTNPYLDDIALLGFKVAVTGSLAKYNLVDQTEDAFMDATGIDASASTNEIRDASNYYIGGSGEITVVKSYTGANQTFVVPSGVGILNFIAWGAAGGGGNASIGGGGGFIEGDVTVTETETLNVKVGGGGGINHTPASQPGGGGGGTGIYRSSTVLAIAGAGGGGENAVNAGPGGGTTGGVGIAAAGLAANGGTQVGGGAAVDGGGAGSLNQGGDAASSLSTAAGGYNGGGSGDGDNVNWTSGGGGGGYYGGSSGGATGSNHGSGAGGSSLTAGTNTQAVGATVANAGHANYAAGTGNGVANSAGQHGHAVIKYSPISNMTLVSTATEAESTPTKGNIVMTYTDGVGTAVLNVDLKAYASRDDGGAWTQLTLTAQGSTGSHFIVSSHSVDISSQPDDKTMRYKIETLNQGATKATRIQAVSLGWS